MKNRVGFVVALVASVVLCCSAWAQPPKVEPPAHDKKTFVGEDGNIYWNKSLPVYISLSSSPDDGQGHVMKRDPEENVKPYYFDTEGTNWIRTRWAVDEQSGKPIYPKTEVLWPVKADGLAPVTKAEFTADGKYVAGEKTYFSGDLKVSLTAKDAVSGTEGIYYSTGSEYQLYEGPVSIDAEREWDLTFYAVDKVGNAEPINDGKSLAGSNGNNFSFIVDKTPPVTSYAISGPNTENIISPSGSIKLSGVDEGAGVNKTFYKFNDNNEKVYSSGLPLSGLKEGDHTVYYKSVDRVKNTEEEKSYNFFLDRSAPEISFSVSGNQFESSSGNLYVSASSQLQLEGTDNKAGVDKVFMKIDGGNYDVYSSPVTSDQAAGKHQLFFYGTDKVENKSVIKSKYYIIDVKAPVIKYAVTGPKYVRHDTLFVNKETYFSISPYEAGNYQSGVNSIQYQYNDGVKIDYEDKFTVPGDGPKTFTMHTADNVGNASEKETVLFIDNVPPVLNYHFSVDKIGQKTVREKNYLIYPREVQLFLGATDNDAGTDKVYYTINEGSRTSYATPVKGMASGNYSIKVESIDMLGNTDTQIIEFSVE